MLWIDIETYASVDLRKTNVYRYVEDPDFRILMAAWAVDDGPVHVAFTPQEIDAIPGLWDTATRAKAAHNAAFERVCFSRFDWQNGAREWPGYLDPREWLDTAMVAAELGYPQSLDGLARALGTEAKGAGTLLINFFCKPNRKGVRNLPEDHPEKWEQFVEYCRQDVATMRAAAKKLLRYRPISQAEHNAFVADQLINDRGIAVDVPLAHAAIEAAELNKADDLAALRELTGVQNPGSVAQLLGWLREQGLRSIPDMTKETVERYLASPTVNTGTPKANSVKQVLELRQGVALTASKKFYAMADGVCADGRLRGQFRFFGAHTGRWSGKGVQLQNLAREGFKTEAEVEGAVLAVLLGERVDGLTLKKLVRSAFLLHGAVVDYTSIEALVVAALAGESWTLEAVRQGRDIYVETAERMGKVLGTTFTRAQGKVAVLALGYNGGVRSLRAMGAEGTDEELLALVQAWRAANPAIVALWAALGEAFRHGGQAGALRVDVVGRDRWLVLPSGRAIVYHDVMLDERFRIKAKTPGPDGKVRYTVKVADGFADPRTGARTMTYGGRLTENATQAVARDLLAGALVRLEKAGLATVGHVHDEVLVEGTQDAARVSELVCQLSPWAETLGLPVAGEGFITTRYRKG